MGVSRCNDLSIITQTVVIILNLWGNVSKTNFSPRFMDISARALEQTANLSRGVNVLKIDFDDYRERKIDLCRLLLTGPFPYKVRTSSSNKGLHYVNGQLGIWDYRREVFDDEMRIWLDGQREGLGLPFHNLLWDTKNGKHAGTWFVIHDSREAAFFIDIILRHF